MADVLQKQGWGCTVLGQLFS